MKLALISDIHGNEQAFKAVLEDISAIGATHVAVLGDISFRGPKPKQCLDLVRDLDGKVIKGNADEWIVRGVNKGEVPDKALQMMQEEQAWAKEQMTQDDLTYLNELPETVEIPLSNQCQLFACHATPDSLFDIISNEADNKEFSIFTQTNERADYYAYGHIHLPFLRSFESKKIINTGSVGLPFDGDARASYVLFDRSLKDIQVQFRRVSYDVEKACFDLDECGYPEPARQLIKNIYRNAVKP
ncbi:metallophosphatase family protein [Salipaludibacillus sp. CUR1]|uniref:Predicted phosphodiesterase n=1 Tax=Salipaludibacillus aurantiacus TaxID=1601833 RepID=A0A1H9P4G5_9BACI|nr:MULTISPECIES: metallophosphoesterase family protein [Salipaludibacillus]MCE7792119.1 metallophosphatase family protein [Salipaludibacillus sp. CUR1]SER42709.1 Predicted phosphodiesterase [Salipaludibacillus aurantiacus]